MATPSPLYFAMQPLQQCLFDKDTGAALAGGIVTYYSDPSFTVRKDIYEQSNQPDGSYIYTNIGSQVTLSSIGSFVDNNGNNFIPFAYPWSIAPGVQGAPGAFESYFITVYSSGGIFQFSITGWPANDFAGSVFTEVTPLTINQITDPQFPVVLFTPDPSTGAFSYTNSGTTTVEVAPGWFLAATTGSGSGLVTLKQESISSDEFSDPPYALDITLASGTSATLYQRIVNSPRLLVNAPAVASYFLAKSLTGNITSLVLTYVPSSGTSVVLANGETTANGAFGEITGTAIIPEPVSTAGGSGYVDIQLAIPDGSSIAVTSFQVVGVNNETEVPAFSEQSTPIQESLLAYYYQSKLEAKPIPSYTIGWDFPFNPCQELGPTVSATALGANKSRYIADQTIAFEAASNVLAYSFSTSAGLTVSTGGTTQFALVQYLDQATARELLKGRMAVKLKAGLSLAASTLTGYVNIYWTTDVTLPNVAAGTNNSLVSALTLGVPTTGNGTWNKVQRSGLGNAVFQLTPTMTEFQFSGWDGLDSSGSTPIDGGTTATFIAIVISFNEITSANTMKMQYATLCAGDIATQPPPLSIEQTVDALEYYYEKSYSLRDIPGVATNYNGALTFPQVLDNYDSGVIARHLRAAAFPITWNSVKSTSTPTITLYSPASTTAGIMQGVIYSGGVPSNLGSVSLAGNWTATGLSEKGVLYFPASATNLITSGAISGASGIQGLIYFQYTVDARLGTY